MSLKDNLVKRSIVIIANVVYINTKLQAAALRKVNTVVHSEYIDSLAFSSVHVWSHVCGVATGRITQDQLVKVADECGQDLVASLQKDIHSVGMTLEKVAVETIKVSNMMQSLNLNG